jgi:Flp pilus assembly protein TadG
MAIRAGTSRGTRGNVGLIAAIAAVPLTALAFFALDASEISRDRAKLQAAADAGALGGAAELGVSSRGLVGIEETAENLAFTSVHDMPADAQVAFDAVADRDQGVVVVNGTATRKGRSPFSKSTTIRVTATAEMLQSQPLCILQSDTEASNGMKVDDTATVRAPGCLVHVNTNIQVAQSARLEAGTIQAAGSASGNMTPRANTGALPIPDPFLALDFNPKSGCPKNAPEIKQGGNQRIDLTAGVHCGKIILSGDVVLNLQPGEHYFMDKIELKGQSRLTGTDVVLIFGSDDSFDFQENTEVRISARRSGPLAGFLIATTRNNDEKFVIASNRVRELLGTIYIPNAELEIATTSSVAEDSAWSVIVAKTITMKENPVLVINKNYAASGVPVPEGVGPSEGAPRLTR